MYLWITMLYTGNLHNMVNQLYVNKKFFKREKWNEFELRIAFGVFRENVARFLLTLKTVEKHCMFPNVNIIFKA